MDHGDLAADIDRNYLAAFEMVARHSGEPAAASRRFGEVVAIATGFASAFYNPVLALSSGSTVGDILAGCAWLAGLGVPRSVHMHADAAARDISEALSAIGLERDAEADPTMALVPIPGPTIGPPELAITLVVLATLGAWHRAFARVFRDESDGSLAHVRAAFPASLLDDPDSRLLAGFVDGRLIATGWAVRSDDVVGVYAVGTDASVRGRGYGTAMTDECLAAGRAWGSRAATLQASADGASLYRRMGFRALGSYVLFMPQPPTL